MPSNISTFGGEIDHLALVITLLTAVCTLIAYAVFFYTIVRFRKRPGRRSAYITGEKWPQLKWVLLPVILVVGLDFFIDITNAHAWHTIKEELPQKALTVRVTGQQFAWTFTEPAQGDDLDGKTDISSVGELHVPIDTDVIFELEAKDVLHSFWIPSLRLKQDAVPGRTIKGWFRATRTGQYDIACAEICGGGHAKMAARLVVDYPQDFALWRRRMGMDNAPPGLKLLNAKGCLACHTTDGTARVGPSYKGIFGSKVMVTTNGAEREVVVDEAYLKRSMLEPAADIVKGFPNVMPPQRGNLTDGEIDQIIEFIKTLK